MGTFRYQIEIGDTGQSRFEEIQAWVDTGATYTWLPRPLLDRLGFSPLYERRFRTADGRVIERDLARVPIRIGHEVQLSLAVFGDENSEPLLGAVTLEEFGLGADTVNHTLTPILSNLLGFAVEVQS